MPGTAYNGYLAYPDILGGSYVIQFSSTLQTDGNNALDANGHLTTNTVDDGLYWAIQYGYAAGNSGSIDPVESVPASYMSTYVSLGFSVTICSVSAQDGTLSCYGSKTADPRNVLSICPYNNAVASPDTLENPYLVLWTAVPTGCQQAVLRLLLPKCLVMVVWLFFVSP